MSLIPLLQGHFPLYCPGMTPLRFRAWHKTEEKWIPFIPDSCESGSVASWQADGQRIAEWSVLNDLVVVMQSTGLRDRHGKEIFEGDIVRQAMPSGEVWQGKIVFEQGAFRITETPTED